MSITSSWLHAVVVLSALGFCSSATAAPAAQAKPATDSSDIRPGTPHKARAGKKRGTTAAREASPESRARNSAAAKNQGAPVSGVPKSDQTPATNRASTASAASVHEKSHPDAKTGTSQAGTRRAALPSKRAKRVETPHPTTTRRTREPSKPCLHAPITFVRGFDGEPEELTMTRCDGRFVSGAVEKLSILTRPKGTPKPEGPLTPVSTSARDATGTKAGHGQLKIKVIDTGLAARLQAIAAQYPGKPIYIVSGHRPLSNGSYHQSAQAVDISVRGIKNEDLVAFCRSLPNTGCGYYPNSSFVHVDVRPAGTGHVYWIDASHPGESARYVAAWPEPVPTTRDKHTSHHVAQADPGHDNDDDVGEVDTSPSTADNPQPASKAHANIESDLNDYSSPGR